jgi:surfeit locus 1 family protein
MSELPPDNTKYNVGASASGDRRRSVLPTLAVVVLTPLLIALGFWQLDRARQKRELIDAFEHGGGAEQTLDEALARGIDPSLYQRVRVEGRYDGARQFLLDGQIIAEGQIGFDVLTPFVLSDGRGTILVDRGFVPQDADRKPLVDIGVNDAERSVQGRIARLPRAGIKLGPASETSSPAWPRVMLYPERGELEAALGAPLLEPILWLDAGEPNGYARHWQVTDMTPERHIAYALQWFAFAATLVVIYFIVARRPRTAERRPSAPP